MSYKNLAELITKSTFNKVSLMMILDKLERLLSSLIMMDPDQLKELSSTKACMILVIKQADMKSER